MVKSNRSVRIAGSIESPSLEQPQATVSSSLLRRGESTRPSSRFEFRRTTNADRASQGSVLRRPETNRVVRRESSSHSDHSRSGVIRFGGPVHRRPAVKVHKHVYVSSHYSHWPWWHRLWYHSPFYGYAYPSVVVVRQPSVIVQDYRYNDPYYDSGEAYHGSDYYEPAQEVYYGSPPATTTDITYLDQPIVYPANPMVIRFWSPWSYRSVWQRHFSPYAYYHFNYQWDRFSSFWWNDYWPNTFMGRSYLHLRL